MSRGSRPSQAFSMILSRFGRPASTFLAPARTRCPRRRSEQTLVDRGDRDRIIERAHGGRGRESIWDTPDCFSHEGKTAIPLAEAEVR